MTEKEWPVMREGLGMRWRLTSTGSNGSKASGEGGQVRFAEAGAWADGVQIWALGPHRSGFRYPANSPLWPQLTAPVSKMKMAVNTRNNMCGALSTLERQEAGSVIIMIKEIAWERLFSCHEHSSTHHPFSCCFACPKIGVWPFGE